MSETSSPNSGWAHQNRGRIGIRFHLVLAISFLLLAPATSGQILTANAGVNSPELPTLIELLSYRSFAHVKEVRSLLQFVYSPTPTLETRLTVPTLYRDLEFKTPSGLDESDSLFGLGDLELRLKYSLFQEDGVLESTRWAVMVEGVAPTGRHREREAGVELPRKLQLGSGGWGVGVGSAFTIIRDRHRFSAEVFYRHRTRHEGFRLGDSFHLNLAYWYRITPATFDPEEQEVEVRGVFELLSTYRSESIGSRGGLDDGGFEVWAAPGVQIYLNRDVLIEASIQVPIFQNIDDPFGRRQWGATLGVKFIF